MSGEIRRFRRFIVLLLSVALAPASHPQEKARPPAPQYADQFDGIMHELDVLLLKERLGDIANVDQVFFDSEPADAAKPTALGAGNRLRVSAYTFVPRALGDRNAPLMVFVPEQAVSALDTSVFKVTRVLLQQGYVVITPHYRGSWLSSGRIDPEGKDIDDTHASRDWAVANLPVDGSRVGIMGWGYGGLHALMNIFRWPDDYQAAYAGAPVSDLVQRMAYQSDEYVASLAASMGNSVRDDVAGYRERSPVFHVEELRTPLLIQSSSNDEFVSVMEVEQLITALKAAGKHFQYKIYEDAPGGHAFGTLDTATGREARTEICRFFAAHLRL